MVIRRYNGVKGVETSSQKDFANIDDKTHNHLHNSELDDKIVWMQMLEKIILQENAVTLINKIKQHFINHPILDIDDFNKYVEETAKEVKDIEYKKLKEQVDNKLSKK